MTAFNQSNDNSSTTGGKRVTFDFSDLAYKPLILGKYPLKQGESII